MAIDKEFDVRSWEGVSLQLESRCLLANEGDLLLQKRLARFRSTIDVPGMG
jgi:hypothetical protein